MLQESDYLHTDTAAADVLVKMSQWMQENESGPVGHIASNVTTNMVFGGWFLWVDSFKLI